MRPKEIRNKYITRVEKFESLQDRYYTYHSTNNIYAILKEIIDNSFAKKTAFILNNKY